MYAINFYSEAYADMLEKRPENSYYKTWKQG